MTDSLIRDLQEKLEKATPGKLRVGEVRHAGGYQLIEYVDGGRGYFAEVQAPISGGEFDLHTRQARCDLIVAAVNALPTLLDRLSSRNIPSEGVDDAFVGRMRLAFYASTGRSLNKPYADAVDLANAALTARLSASALLEPHEPSEAMVAAAVAEAGRTREESPTIEDRIRDILRAALRASRIPPSKIGEEEELARLFHDTYERLAPAFQYDTRVETRKFDPASANGRLMLAVCKEVLAALNPTAPQSAEPTDVGAE